MAEISVTVKVNPPDGSWQTANQLIKKIAETNTVGEKLHIEVDGVFSEGKSARTNAGNVFNFGNIQNQHAAPTVNMF